MSMRWDSALVERLQRRAAGSGSSVSALAQRYVEEALRMADHPGVVFQDGPAGRRASLAVGPDVWEVVRVLRDVEERGEAALGAAADAMGLDVAAVRVAARYHGAHPHEASAMIEENERAAEESYRAWAGQQQLLA